MSHVTDQIASYFTVSHPARQLGQDPARKNEANRSSAWITATPAVSSYLKSSPSGATQSHGDGSPTAKTSRDWYTPERPT